MLSIASASRLPCVCECADDVADKLTAAARSQLNCHRKSYRILYVPDDAEAETVRAGPPHSRSGALIKTEPNYRCMKLKNASEYCMTYAMEIHGAL